MTKHTSKSRSETQEISSPSGTYAPTEATGKATIGRAKAVDVVRTKKAGPSVVDEPIASLKEVSAKARAMTPAELRKSLVAAGIIRTDGKLTSVYSHPRKKKKKSD